MKIGNFKVSALAIISTLIIVPGIIAFFMYIGYSNKERSLRNIFGQKTSERTAFYDKMWKTLSQKSQVAVKNDSGFRKNIDLIMNSRKDGEGLLFKFVTESNPNANYSEVSALYQDLSRSIEAEREGFFVQEKVMQSIKLEHDNLLSIFPGSIFLQNRSALQYKAITSDRTDEVMSSGKDNNTSVF